MINAGEGLFPSNDLIGSELRITKEIYMVGDGKRGLSHPLDCCIYLVDCGGVFVLIDAGAGLNSELILENILNESIALEKVKYLLLTHAHSDHAGGVRYLQENLSVEVFAPIVEAELMAFGSDEELGLNMARGVIYPLNYNYIHSKADRVLVDGEEVQIGGKTLRLIQVPGHSPGSSCLLIREDNVLFSGDVVFHGGTIGLGNWPGCSLDEYRRNIGKLGNLGVRMLFPGHFLFTLRDGQKHIDTAIDNLKKPWVPPAWQHNHPHY
ncbi:MAG: MBL fold metallo-hydrolase [Aigarchaeota archaeon]|nr:MBL fold metallo-hydrolase [Candidatus Calditenuaceae archaeon]MDW8022067.1 MBL fold metallo-hydrolase [Nitrososphaerota archaeon]